jgi:outer membrane receptor protein involved in Fe transport
MRIAAAVALGMGSIVAADPAPAAIRKQTNIPAQSLGPALKEFAASQDLQLLYFSDTVRHLRTSGAAGDITTDEALTEILKGTGLTYRYLDERTVTILPVAEAERGQPSSASGKADIRPPSHGAAAPSHDAKEAQKNPSFWDRFRLARAAQADAAVTSPANTDEPPEDSRESNKPSIEEVVVTAQKRIERLQDVPVPVTALDAQTLVSSNQLRLQDYYTKIPGVVFAADGVRSSAGALTIRGLGSNGGNPTVGIVVDDVPYGSSTVLGGGGGVPDVDPSELARVEVLRGPQGTLYGASSIGGLLKYMTVDPSVEQMSGRVQVGISGVQNGNEPGYNLRGAINIPLSDVWALRASGFTRRDPGYIDVPSLDRTGVNTVDVSGGRLAALWRPSDALSLKLSALLQNTDRDGVSRVDLEPGLGDLQQHALPQTGRFNMKSHVYSAILNAKLGVGELTSITAYNVNDYSDQLDLSYLYGADAGKSLEHNRTRKYSQEIRFSLPLGTRVDWLSGAFYTRERSDYVQDLQAVDLDTGAALSRAAIDVFPTALSEYALYTHLTVRVSDRFDVQMGGRESENRQRYEESLSGPLVGGSIISPEVEAKENAFTYLLTPRFRISSSLMAYARLASGYRPGGPNSLAVLIGVPLFFESDQTQNYEVGIKGTVLDQALSFDASMYYIDWKNFQLNLYDPTFGTYFTNGSRAKSQGVELSAEARLPLHFTITTAMTWNDAALTESLPNAATENSSAPFGSTGERMPLSSRFSGNISLNQDIPFSGDVTGFWGLSVSYVGERADLFRTADDAARGVSRGTLPSYTQTDAQLGVHYASWTCNAFVSNLTDKRGVISPLNIFKRDSVTYIQPRTYGMSLAKTF